MVAAPFLNSEVLAMAYIDEKFKDNSPAKTVENIRRLLSERGLEVEERWIESGIDHCYSNRVTIAGTNLGANGKGVSRELARASGHAELMERLQSGYRGVGTLQFSDARQMSREELTAENGAYFALMAEKTSENEYAAFTSEDMVDISLSYGAAETCLAIPMYDAVEDKMMYMPYALLRRAYSSNGLAAGNSTAEAIVQGFSEIVERYCQGKFLRQRLTPPTIPDDYLAKFPTAWSIITQIRQEGYQLLVKDCSLGEGYPVVASAVIDPETRGYRVIFGSSPVFEIALERSLTEMFQGCRLKTMPMVQGFFCGEKRTGKDMESAFTSGRSSYPMDFFGAEPSYEFRPFEDRSGANNQGLVAYILEYLKKKNRTMLLRDLSHLGFHTYRIIVPGMSELDTFVFSGKTSIYRLYLEIENCRTDLSKASFEELYAYKQFYAALPTTGGESPDISRLSTLPLMLEKSHSRFLGTMSAAYAEWATGNAAQAYRYLRAASPLAPAGEKEFLDCLQRLMEMRFNKYSLSDALPLLRVFYEPPLVEQAAACFREANPFSKYLFRCSKECESCQWAQVCRYAANLAVTERLNEAVRAFDNEGAFQKLRSCIAEAKGAG